MLNSLIKLGFSEKEALIYEILSLTESLTAATLARRANIKRASIYEILQNLEKSGFISHYKKNRTAYFYLESAERLLLDYRAKLKIAEEVTQKLREKKKKQDITLEVYRDAEGFSELYHEILTTSDREFCAWSNFESFDTIIDKKDDQVWTNERVNSGIRPRLIMLDNPVSRDFQNHDDDFPRITKLITGKKNFSSTLVISNERVYLFDNHPEVIAIKIQHPSIASMIQEVFDAHWGQI